MAQIIVLPRTAYGAPTDEEIRRKLLKVALNCAAASITAALQMLDNGNLPDLQSLPDPGALISFVASMGSTLT